MLTKFQELWRSLHEEIIAAPAVVRAGNEKTAASEIENIRRRSARLTDQAVEELHLAITRPTNGGNERLPWGEMPNEPGTESGAIRLVVDVLRTRGPGRPALHELLSERRQWVWREIVAAPVEHAEEMVQLDDAAHVWVMDHVVFGMAPRCRREKRLRGLYLLQRVGQAVYRTVTAFGVPAVSDALNQKVRRNMPAVFGTGSAGSIPTLEGVRTSKKGEDQR